MQHGRVVAEVRRRLADATYQRLGEIGSVDASSGLPLVDRGAAARAAGEPGVSHLVRTGRETLLFDTGLNLFRRSRSALVDNAEALPHPLCCSRRCAELSLFVVHNYSAHDDARVGVRQLRADKEKENEQW